MRSGLPQQDPSVGFTIPKSVVTPQHGQRAAKLVDQGRETRSFQPRPGH